MSDNYRILLEACQSAIAAHDFSAAFKHAHNLLDLYEKDKSGKRVFNVFEDIEKIFINTPNAILFNYDIQGGLPEIIGFDIFKRLLNQLIDNAIRYAFRHKDKGVISIKISSNDVGKLVIQFSDNGSGIEKEEIEKIFDPFYTSNMGLDGGAGMGLYILQKVVHEVFNGEITCDSEIGKFTTFKIEMNNQINC